MVKNEPHNLARWHGVVLAAIKCSNLVHADLVTPPGVYPLHGRRANQGWSDGGGRKPGKCKARTNNRHNFIHFVPFFPSFGEISGDRHPHRQ